MDLYGAIDTVIEQGKVNIKQAEGDYIGENGLLYCGKCHTKKQTEVNLLGKICRPMCLCKCEQEKRAKEEEARKEFELRQKIARNRDAGFPEAKMKTWTFENDDLKDPKLSQAMKRYVENFGEFCKNGKGLLLYGGVGSGKTYLAACVVNALLDKGYTCLMTNFARLSNTISGMFEGKQRYIDDINRNTLLVIDDLATERDTEYMNEIVFQLIDARYRSGLPLIVTTNLTGDELFNPKDMNKARVYSRLLEMCIPIEVEGKDRRKEKMKADYKKTKELLGL